MTIGNVKALPTLRKIRNGQDLILDSAEPTPRHSRTLKVAAVSIVALLVTAGSANWLGGLLWPKLLDPTTAGAASALGTVFGAVFGLLSALASAIAAVAAYKAAKQSDETAKRAGEALGLAMEPDLTAFVQTAHINPGSDDYELRKSLVVRNRSRWPAADVRVYEPGRRAEPLGQILYISPAEQLNPTVAPKPWEVDLEIPESVHGGAEGFGENLIMEFSDERRILRWKTTIRSQQDYRTERVR